jgi:hypothetical protein
MEVAGFPNHHRFLRREVFSVFKSERVNRHSVKLATGGVLLMFMVLPVVPAEAQTQAREEQTDRVGQEDLPAPGTFGGPEDVCRETCKRLLRFRSAGPAT